MRHVIPMLVITGVVAQFGLDRWATTLPLSVVWIGALAIAVLVILDLEPRELNAVGTPPVSGGTFILYASLIFAPLFPLGYDLLTREGFPKVGLSHIAYDDYSNWLANLSQIEAGEYEFRFGGIFNLFLILAFGLARIVHLIFGFPLTGFGVVVLALTFAVLLLGVLAGVTAIRVHQSLLRAGIRSSEASLVSFGVLMALTWFLRDVQRLGHLTAGLVVLVVLHEAVCLGRRPAAAELFWRMLIVLLATTLWFPLEPLRATGLVFLLIMILRARPRGLSWAGARTLAGSILLLVALSTSFSLLIRLVRALLNLVFSSASGSGLDYVNALFSLPGGVASLSTTFIVVLSITMTISLVQNGLADPRNLVSGVGILFTILVRIFDYLPDGKVGYGSEKLLWMSAVLSLILSCLVLIENLLPLTQTKLSNGRNFLLVGLLLPVLLLPAGLGLIRESVVYSAPEDAIRIEAQTSQAWLSAGVFARSQPLATMPKVCLTVFNRGAEERVIGSFEGYPCTRIVAGFGYASEPYAAEESIAGYAIRMSFRGDSLSEVAKHSLANPDWLTENVLLIEPSGEVVREERLLDVLSQEFLSHPMDLEWSGRIPEDFICKAAPVAIDSRRGVFAGWASSEVKALLVVGSEPSDQMRLPLTRVVRDDVASLLGAHERRAGFQSVGAEVPQTALIFARMRGGEIRPVGEVQECTPLSELNQEL